MTDELQSTKQTDTLNLGAVLYTDGSAAPNPGYGGWGIHGYTYLYDTPYTPPKSQKKNIPTTKGYLNATEIDEECPAVKKVTTINCFGTGFKPIVNNNEMEFHAFEKGLDLAKAQGYKQLQLLTDSNLVVISMGERYRWWANNQFKNSAGEPLKNKDAIIRCRTKYEDLLKNCHVNVKHIRGHKGFLGNELADKLANKGTMLHKHGKEYEEFDLGNKPTPKTTYHDFFTKNRWYFLGGSETQTHRIGDWYVYLCGTHGKGKKDPDVGSKTPDGLMQLVCLKEPEEVLEKVQRLYREICKQDYEFVVCGKLDTVLTPVNYKDIWEENTSLICLDKVEKTLSLPNGKLVCIEYNPAHLSFIQMARYQDLIETFEMMIGKRESRLIYTDITDQLRLTETDKKGKSTYKLNPTIMRQDYLKTKLDYADDDGVLKHFEKRFKLNVDLPDKNQLNKLIKLHGKEIKIYLVSRRLAKGSYRHQCAIVMDECYGIWGNPFSSVIHVE